MKDLKDLIPNVYHKPISQAFQYATQCVASLSYGSTDIQSYASKRSLSSLMHDSFVSELKKHLLPLGGVKFYTIRGLSTFFFEDTNTHIRVKKVNQNYKPSTSVTNQSRLFEQQISLFESYVTRNVTLGYQIFDVNQSTYGVHAIYHNPAGANIVHTIPLIVKTSNIKNSTVNQETKTQEIQKFELKNKDKVIHKKVSEG
ncbi:MAG: hypothetical protein J0M05_08370 [Candidatus Kapabacteria bacterium]|nr:hypothetical protein [Candidatus Kapabacteria bacterium]